MNTSRIVLSFGEGTIVPQRRTKPCRPAALGARPDGSGTAPPRHCRPPAAPPRRLCAAKESSAGSLRLQLRAAGREQPCGPQRHGARGGAGRGGSWRRAGRNPGEARLRSAPGAAAGRGGRWPQRCCAWSRRSGRCECGSGAGSLGSPRRAALSPRPASPAPLPAVVPELRRCPGVARLRPRARAAGEAGTAALLCLWRRCCSARLPVVRRTLSCTAGGSRAASAKCQGGSSAVPALMASGADLGPPAALLPASALVGAEPRWQRAAYLTGMKLHFFPLGL